MCMHFSGVSFWGPGEGEGGGGGCSDCGLCRGLRWISQHNGYERLWVLHCHPWQPSTQSQLRCDNVNMAGSPGKRANIFYRSPVHTCWEPTESHFSKSPIHTAWDQLNFLIESFDHFKVVKNVRKFCHNLSILILTHCRPINLWSLIFSLYAESFILESRCLRSEVDT